MKKLLTAFIEILISLQMFGQTRISYSYDAAGNRTSRTSNTALASASGLPSDGSGAPREYPLLSPLKIAWDNLAVLTESGSGVPDILSASSRLRKDRQIALISTADEKNHRKRALKQADDEE